MVPTRNLGLWSTHALALRAYVLTYIYTNDNLSYMGIYHYSDNLSISVKKEPYPLTFSFMFLAIEGRDAKQQLE